VLLNAIFRIDEISQSHAGNIVASIDTERSNEYLSSKNYHRGNMQAGPTASYASLIKKQDPKMAAKVLYNINQTNRLDRLLNNARSPMRAIGSSSNGGSAEHQQ
jgi:hypothetical protein